jgi:hypothetical protein
MPNLPSSFYPLNFTHCFQVHIYVAMAIFYVA